MSIFRCEGCNRMQDADLVGCHADDDNNLWCEPCTDGLEYDKLVELGLDDLAEDFLEDACRTARYNAEEQADAAWKGRINEE